MTSDASPAPRHGSGFTERVRQELAGIDLPDLRGQRAELAAILLLGGALHLHPGAPPAERLTIEVVTTSGAVARRAFALLQSLHHLRPELRVRAPGGVHRQRSYAVVITLGAERIARDAGMLDDDGRPDRTIPEPVVTRRADALAYLRGALLATGSISAPERPPHLEIATGTDAVARRLAAICQRAVPGTATAVGGARPRLVVKSGETIGELLAAVGAAGAFLAWDEHRLRRDLRNEATRLANADAANLRRAIDAAADQTRAVEAVLSRLGWDALPDDLREVALVRLANPAASLAELGQLCDPPVGKSTVHRRLRRLLELTDGQ